MDAHLLCYHIKGRKVFSMSLPAPATNLGVVKLSRNRVIEALIVSLSNGEVRIYNHKTLIHSMQLDDVVTAMRWGKFGREANRCARLASGERSERRAKRARKRAAIEASGERSERERERRSKRSQRRVLSRWRRAGGDIHRLRSLDLAGRRGGSGGPPPTTPHATRFRQRRRRSSSTANLRAPRSCAFIGRNGSLTLKMMSRQANLEKTELNTGPPAEQDIPLKVPKKTKLYVEQSEREVANAVTMHRTFQRDLCRIRLTTAKVSAPGKKRSLAALTPPPPRSLARRRTSRSSPTGRPG
jgi:hypothetical protein